MTLRTWQFPTLQLGPAVMDMYRCTFTHVCAHVTWNTLEWGHTPYCARYCRFANHPWTIRMNWKSLETRNVCPCSTYASAVIRRSVWLSLGFWPHGRPTTTDPRGLRVARRVAAGDFHTCAITADGKLHCFGSNDHGASDHGHSHSEKRNRRRNAGWDGWRREAQGQDGRTYLED